MLTLLELHSDMITAAALVGTLALPLATHLLVLDGKDLVRATSIAFMELSMGPSKDLGSVLTHLSLAARQIMMLGGTSTFS